VLDNPSGDDGSGLRDVDQGGGLVAGRGAEEEAEAAVALEVALGLQGDTGKQEAHARGHKEHETIKPVLQQPKKLETSAQRPDQVQHP